jgi:hypothetical protein
LLDIKVKEQYHKIFNSGYFQKPTFLFDIFTKISLIFAPLGPYQQQDIEDKLMKHIPLNEKTLKASWVCQKAIQARCCETVPFLQLH